MKLALVTTTISPPSVLHQYRALDADVPFYVAGDDGCDDAAIQSACDAVGNCTYLSYEAQAALGYQCHAIIGPHSIQRRDIATLEAIKSGADCVVTVDTDNAPAGPWFLDIFRQTLGHRHSQVVTLDCGWYNPGRLTEPPHISRGFPLSCRDTAFSLNMMTTLSAGRIGIVQGIAVGDPDIAAVDRIATHPEVGLPWADIRHFVLRVQDTWAPINSQSTGYVRELTPLMAVLPGIGRYDDIFGSFIAQRVLMDTNWHVAFGQPFVRQERHPHDLLTDLKAEIFGMEYTEHFVADLKALDLSGTDTILGKLELVYEGMSRLSYIPSQTVEFGFAWCVDVAAALQCE